MGIGEEGHDFATGWMESFDIFHLVLFWIAPSQLIGSAVYLASALIRSAPICVISPTSFLWIAFCFCFCLCFVLLFCLISLLFRIACADCSCQILWGNLWIRSFVFCRKTTSLPPSLSPDVTYLWSLQVESNITADLFEIFQTLLLKLIYTFLCLTSEMYINIDVGIIDVLYDIWCRNRWCIWLVDLAVSWHEAPSGCDLVNELCSDFLDCCRLLAVWIITRRRAQIFGITLATIGWFPIRCQRGPASGAVRKNSPIEVTWLNWLTLIALRNESKSMKEIRPTPPPSLSPPLPPESDLSP